MEEYRRFISYMYLYEEGRKTINSGFVRVESRTGQCRILIHMSGVDNSKDGSHRVYMLTRESGGYIGIAVGEVQFHQQAEEREFVMDSDHLMGTTYDLDCITGMVLLGENGSVYGTRWDDEPLETEKFVNGEPLSDNVVRFGNENVDAAENPAQDFENKVKEIEIMNDTNPGTESFQERLKIDPARYSDENPMIPEEELIANLENTAKMQDIEKDDTECKEKPVIVASDAVIEEVKSMQGTDPARPVNVYDLLMSQLPQMYPFEDDSVAACVRLELQDIGRLPMSCWMYGSNSFLLHGYYCYRHLILAKVEQKKDKEDTNGHSGNDDASEGGIVYLMGVPGIWQHREQYMASMFGFRKFRPVSRENQGSGAFGYWCVALEI